MGTFDIFNVLNMLGGLALFLFGMSYMGNSLERASSGKLESLLEKMTNSRMKGVLLGLAVTAIIQSSSATTVTVVGFVNSGIMKLAQAVPVIMGANVGTTVTAWMLSLTGISGDSLLLKLLKPTSFTPVLAIIGTAMTLFSKSEKKKDTAGILLGFSVLMYGMDMMSSAVKPLAEVEAFRNILIMFENPILGVLAGLVLTAVIQSSSASVGILQALSLTGTITYGAALPIIMGQNIGTCVTALISCIGANKNARRASMVHLYFNIIGTLLAIFAYMIAKYLLRLGLFALPIDAAGIATVHSVFNITCTVILLPFTKGLEKLACLTIRDHKEEVESTVMLDERLLTTPTFALARCKELIAQMSDLAANTMRSAMGLIDKYTVEGAGQVASGESKADMYEDKLGSFLVKLSTRRLSDEESRDVSRILHGIGDLERISDHALNVSEVGQELYEKKICFSEDAQTELVVVSRAVTDILELSVRAFRTGNTELAKQVEPLEEVIDDLIRELKLRHIERLKGGRCTVEMGFIFNDLLSNYERVADHCSNLAICVIELAQGELNAHEYLGRTESENSFAQHYHAVRLNYSLPAAVR